jgi:hypothetical protein
MLVWASDPDIRATTGYGLPHGLVAIIGHEAILGIGLVWLLCDASGAVIGVSVAESENAAKDEIMARALAQERKPGRRPSALRGMSSFNRNHRRNVRIAALHKANQIAWDQIERLYWDIRIPSEKLDEIRHKLQIILCDMAITALAESVRRYSTVFERYLELPSSVVDVISKSIESCADQIDSLASGPMVDEKPNGEMVLKDLRHVWQHLEEITTSLRREGFLIDRELLMMAHHYCAMDHQPPPPPKISSSMGPPTPLESLIAQGRAMESFYKESQEVHDDLISRLIAAQFQYKQYYSMIKDPKN